LAASVLGLALVVAGVSAGAWALSAPSAQQTQQAQVQTNSKDVLPAYDIEPAVLVAPRPTRPETPVVRPDRPEDDPAAGAPRRLVVPQLGVDVPVVEIDAPGGVLRPPDDPQVLGWWRDGVRPGAARGSALITGHTVSSGGGAFDDLETLRRGAPVSVRTEAGVVDYEVVSVTIYRKAALARHAARVFSQTVPGRLVLITCEDWNGTAYESNAVVTAAPVG